FHLDHFSHCSSSIRLIVSYPIPNFHQTSAVSSLGIAKCTGRRLMSATSPTSYWNRSILPSRYLKRIGVLWRRGWGQRSTGMRVGMSWTSLLLIHPSFLSSIHAACVSCLSQGFLSGPLTFRP